MSTFAMSNTGTGQRPPPSGGVRPGSNNQMRGRGDEGDAPVPLPLGSSGRRLDIIADSVASSLTTPSQEERRREERRSKRAAARETKRSMLDGPELRTALGLAPTDPMPDFDDPDENYQAPVVPGSFAVAGPGAREAQEREGIKGKPAAFYDDHDNLIEGGGADEEKTHQNLPVAFEAEVVFDYPNHDVVVAQKDEGRRTVPLHWLLIIGCIMFIAAVAVSVGLGVALGGKEGRSSSSSSLIVEPTFQPVVPPTFTPVVPPTFTPVVPPTFTPVVPPTFPPQEVPTYEPVVPPTFTPVVPPTFTPVVPPTYTPVVPPTYPPVTAPSSPVSSPTSGTSAPTSAQSVVVQPTITPAQPITTTTAPTTIPVTPTSPPVAPTNPPVAPTNPPVAPTEPPVAPTNPPVAPTDVPTDARIDTSNNPIYTGSKGLPCKCRFYTQDMLVSSTDDYRTLSSAELQAFIDALLGIFDNFNPYPFRRHLATVRSIRHTRFLQPSSVNYSFDVVKQTLIGTAGTDPFGVRVKYDYEQCADDPAYIDDYHKSFQDYLQNSGNLDSIASQLRDAGMSSLTEITAPVETGEFCG